jgi:hypothetical protein
MTIILKKINGNFGLDYKVFKILRFQVLLVLILQTESKSFAKQILYWINPSDKVFDVLKFGFQSAINDNDYSFDLFGTYKRLLKIIML